MGAFASRRSPLQTEGGTPTMIRQVKRGVGSMGIVYNRLEGREQRRFLRKNMPQAEVLLWSRLRRRQIHGERFLRQYGVDQYILDFYCPRLKLAIEVDGDSHFSVDAAENDSYRQKHIENYGIRFMRITNTDVYENLDGVCEDIYHRIEEMNTFPR
jgi:very-short-patch-repair endonuclease